MILGWSNLILTIWQKGKDSIIIFCKKGRPGFLHGSLQLTPHILSWFKTGTCSGQSVSQKLVCGNSHSWTTLKFSMKEWSYWNWITLSGWRCCTEDTRSWSSVVGIVTRIWTGWSGVRILVATRDFPPLQNIQIGPGVHPPSYSMGTVVLSWG